MLKRLQRIGIILSLTFLALSACQPVAQPTTPPPPSPTATLAYPPPAQFVPPVTMAYPGPSEGSTNYVPWSDVEQAVLNGRVSQAYLDQFGHVTLVLKDRTMMLALAPAVDSFDKLLDQCGQTCKDLQVNR